MLMFTQTTAETAGGEFRLVGVHMGLPKDAALPAAAAVARMFRRQLLPGWGDEKLVRRAGQNAAEQARDLTSRGPASALLRSRGGAALIGPSAQPAYCIKHSNQKGPPALQPHAFFWTCFWHQGGYPKGPAWGMQRGPDYSTFVWMVRSPAPAEPVDHIGNDEVGKYEVLRARRLSWARSRISGIKRRDAMARQSHLDRPRWPDRQDKAARIGRRRTTAFWPQFTPGTTRFGAAALEARAYGVALKLITK